MEWTREKTLSLIQEYRKRRGLWDMTHDDYRKKDMKQKLLVEVSSSLGGNIPIMEIEKKFHTLRTQYHREINRMKRKEPYNSKWFGFKYLQFLSSPKACRSNKGRIKSEITEEGTVTTKYIIREAVPSQHDTGAASVNSNENEEFLTLQRKAATITYEAVPASNGATSTSSRSHELEKLIEETTKDVEDIEDAKPKMPIKEITVPLEHHHHQHHHHHQAYNSGELTVSGAEETQQVQAMDEEEDPIDAIDIQPATEDELAYQAAVSSGGGGGAGGAGGGGVSTAVSGHTQSITTTVHAIPTRIIKIQRRDTCHDNGDYYESDQQQQHHHQQQQQTQHHIHTLSPNGSTTKRIYYDASGHQHTTTILTAPPAPAQPNTNLTLLNATTTSASSSPSPSSKLHLRNVSSGAAPQRDEFATYGEYVGNEMRGITSREILISLKHKINTALFEASMAELQK